MPRVARKLLGEILCHHLLYADSIQQISKFMQQVNSQYAMYYNDYINQKGFLNQEILNFVFGSNHNYIQKFKTIEYEELNLEDEPVNLEYVLKKFLIQEKKSLKEIQKSKILIKKFISYLMSKSYKFSKKKVAEVLKMSNSTFYRRLYGK